MVVVDPDTLDSLWWCRMWPCTWSSHKQAPTNTTSRSLTIWPSTSCSTWSLWVSLVATWPPSARIKAKPHHSSISCCWRRTKRRSWDAFRRKRKLWGSRCRMRSWSMSWWRRIKNETFWCWLQIRSLVFASCRKKRSLIFLHRLRSRESIKMSK